MKRILFICFFSFVTCSAFAQWKGGLSDYVFAFGVHDTNLFSSWSSPGNGSDVGRYVPGYGWTEAHAGIDFSQGSVTSFASLGKYFFAGMTHSDGSNAPSYLSTNDGINWIETGISSPITVVGKYWVAFGGHGIYRSTDSGMNWNLAQDNIPVKIFATIGGIVLASNASDLWRSTDNGTSWTTILHPFSPPVTFAVIDTIIFAGSSTGTSGLSRSNDSGGTWTQVSLGHPVSALATDGKNLFAGTTDSGVYISTDTGQHWRAVSDGLSAYLNVSALIVFGDTAWVASSGAGRYFEARRPISEMTAKSAVAASPQPSDTLSIYPNPATESVTISSASTSIYEISVLNVLGEEVLDVPNARESNISFDLSKLPAGTYFARIVTVGGIMVRKIIKE